MILYLLGVIKDLAGKVSLLNPNFLDKNVVSKVTHPLRPFEQKSKLIWTFKLQLFFFF